ncbi:MAG: DUF2809 domain-containing protein [Candidatus Cloacimonetes bacterium]|nr:DUF2809 domain-containing protein [Candidatus Cloacimonadota bacterium]
MRKRNQFLILIIILLVIMGFTSKFYQGSSAKWLNNSFVGLLYVTCWCLVISLIAPKVKSLIIAIGVLLGTCILEIFQLWHPLFLEYIRSSFLGRTLIGTTFVSSDFAYYIVGAGFGWLILKKIDSITDS